MNETAISNFRSKLIWVIARYNVALRCVLNISKCWLKREYFQKLMFVFVKWTKLISLQLSRFSYLFPYRHEWRHNAIMMTIMMIVMMKTLNKASAMAVCSKPSCRLLYTERYGLQLNKSQIILWLSLMNIVLRLQSTPVAVSLSHHTINRILLYYSGMGVWCVFVICCGKGSTTKAPTPTPLSPVPDRFMQDC